VKTFLVFLSIFLVSITFLVYQGDLAHYIQLQEYLKGLAEECASGAALYFEENAFGQGAFIFSETEARAFVTHLVEQGGEALAESGEGVLTYEMELFDAEKGFDAEGEIPSVQVTLTYTCPDLFRLPFLRVTEVCRQARYEQKEF